MGFLMDVIEQGLYGACVDAHYNHLAKSICDRYKVMPNVESDSDDEEVESETADAAATETQESNGDDNFFKAVFMNMINNIDATDDSNSGDGESKKAEIVEDESDNLSAYTKGHWDENL